MDCEDLFVIKYFKLIWNIWKSKMLEQTTEEFQQSVCETWNTNLKQVRQDVEQLKEWIKTQHHLPQCSSDTMLSTYLVGCKNSMEKAKRKIDNYYTVRSKFPDLFAERDPTDEKMKVCCEEVRLIVLPKLTPDGCRVIMGSFVTGDIQKYDIWTYNKRLLSLKDIVMNREAFNNGLYYVFDSTNVSLSHVLAFTPNIARQMVYCLQDVLPFIIKGIIFINTPSFMGTILNILKPFMKSKLFQKIHFHTEGHEVLQQYFPNDMIPKDYGGYEDTRDTLNEAWVKYLQEKRDWFLKEGSLTVDEEKRIKVASAENEFGGLQGSFRTLCLD